MSVLRMKTESSSPVQRIKDEARRRITAVVGPEWKQQNILARAAELHLKETRGVITAPESEELTTILGLWDWVKAVRAASEVLEVSLPANYRDDSHWPAALV